MSRLTKAKKLTRGEIIVFGTGDIFGGGGQLIINFFYLIFLTDVVGMNPGLAGTIVLISRIWDAISDPLMGVISDNTKSKYGRRRPYILVGAIGIIVASIMLWWPAYFESQVATFAYVLFAYLFYSTISTIIMVPYSSMSSELSMDYKERNTINGTRLFFSQLSSLICAVLPMEIVKLASTVETGYIIMGITFGVFFAIPLFLVFFMCRERAPMDMQSKSEFSLKSFATPLKIRSFRILIMIYMLAFFAMDVISSIFAYYMKYFLERPNELNYVLGVMLIMQIIFLPIVVKMANKIGKSKVFIMGASIWILGAALLGFFSPTWPVFSIYVIGAITGIGLSGCVTIPWLMFPDVTDVGELYFGDRKSGSFSGIMTFIRKTSSALGIFLVSQILNIAGYVKPETVDGKEVLFEQPGSLITALKIIIFAIPVVLLIVTIFFARKYPITKTIHERLRKLLEFKRGESDQPVSKKEEEELKRILI